MAPQGNGYNNRGRGRGRGASPFRGRGFYSPRGRGARGGQPMYRDLDVIDVDIQQYADDTPVLGHTPPAPRARGRGFSRGRGRGRGSSTPQNLQVFNNGYRAPPPPRREDGSGTATPAGRGPSRGLGARYNANMPLSKLLALDRPYLRPIIFVPAQMTPVLFQREEELLEVNEFQEPEDHVPTAEQVSRVFSHQQPPPLLPQDSIFHNTETDLFAEADSEVFMTVDFGSLGELMGDTSTFQPEPKPESAASPKPPTLEVGQGMNVFDAIKEALLLKNVQDTNAPSSEDVQASETNLPRMPEQRLDEEVAITTLQETVIQIEESTEEQQDKQQDEPPLFVEDPNPTRPSTGPERIAYTPTLPRMQPLGSVLSDDDEVIVYDAPHPRSGRGTPNIPAPAVTSGKTHGPVTVRLPNSRRATPNIPAQPAVSLPRASGSSIPKPVISTDPTSATNAPAQPIADMSISSDAMFRATEINCQQTASPRARRLTKRDRHGRAAQWKGKKQGSFENYGAMLEERLLQEDGFGPSGRRERREGSDIDWGDADDDDPEIERVSSSLGAMDIDADLDIHAMQSFARSMNNNGMEYARIDDIEDAEKLRLEDEQNEDPSSGSEDVDSELAAVVNAEEERLTGEAGDGLDSDAGFDEEEEDEISSDDEVTPTRSFQMRLTQVRQSAKAKGKMKESAFSAAQIPSGSLFGGRMSKLRERGKAQAEDSEDDDKTDGSDDFDANFTWADRDEDYLDDIQDLLVENDDILSDRKQRKLLFKSVHDGEFSVTPAKKKRDYGMNLPPELRARWENDRALKAENKRRRAAARLEAAADPFAVHKGGKKGRKAILRASRLAAEAYEEAPHNAGPDMSMLVRQMRTFVENINLTVPMAFPPMGKEARAQVHEIADAFGLKSTSNGKGAARYTTIIKTSRSGVRINERKIQRILRSGGDWGFTRPGNPGYGGKGKGNGAPKHREGDEVGKAAPKIGEANIGFQMLASMGWAEGERIGVSGGIDAPLTAIIKNSKLGLGATR